jgi:hypothetical protein
MADDGRVEMSHEIGTFGGSPSEFEIYLVDDLAEDLADGNKFQNSQLRAV